MLGTGLSAVTVVIILEFILAVYSVTLVITSNKKSFKIMHAVFTVLWVVLALMNMFASAA